MKIRLTMDFDVLDYKTNFPDIYKESIIVMMKEDFADTIQKQWTTYDIIQAVEIIEKQDEFTETDEDPKECFCDPCGDLECKCRGKRCSWCIENQD